MKEFILDIKPSQKDIILTLAEAPLFWLILAGAQFEIWGRFSESLAITAGMFLAMWTGSLVERIRFSG